MGAGGRLFQDYQYLSRIWTHPKCLKIAQLRADERDKNKWMDESSEEEEDTSSSELSSSSSSDSDIICEEGEDKKRKKKKKKKKNEGKEDKTSDDLNKTEEDEKKQKKREKKEKKKREIDEDDKLINEEKDKKKDRENSPEYTRTGRRVRACNRKDGSSSPRRSPTPPPEEEYWWTKLIKGECPEEEDLSKPGLSGKMLMLINILRESETVGDKVLVFSQSLASLDMIEEYLKYEDDLAQQGKLTEESASAVWGWTAGNDYFRMDGGTNPDTRQRQMALFNDVENSQARLFLISTRAGSLGVNLVAANRVVIFDASWNPSYDVQSIFRVYRFGQSKPVYIYRLIAQATMEEKIYDRQVTKQSLSQRVIDEHQIDRHFNSHELHELYRFEPDRLDDPNRKVPPTPVLPKDRLLADMLNNMKEWIYHYHEHDSLLENKVEDQLTEEERKSAWEEFEREKTTGFRHAQPQFQQFTQQTGQQQQQYPQYQTAGGIPNINFTPHLHQYLNYIATLAANAPNRMQAEMSVMKMIYAANPQLQSGHESLVYQRMKNIIRVYEKQARDAALRQQKAENEARYNAQLYNLLGNNATGAGAAGQAANAAHAARMHSPYAARAAASAAFQRAAAPRVVQQPISLSQEDVKARILRQIDLGDRGLSNLIPYVYKHFPPRDKRRFGDEEQAKFNSLVRDKRPEARKRIKHLLLKVIQDYHPDKVDASHGQDWKLVSEEISKRLNKYYEELK